MEITSHNTISCERRRRPKSFHFACNHSIRCPASRRVTSEIHHILSQPKASINRLFYICQLNIRRHQAVTVCVTLASRVHWPKQMPASVQRLASSPVELSPRRATETQLGAARHGVGWRSAPPAQCHRTSDSWQRCQAEQRPTSATHRPCRVPPPSAARTATERTRECSEPTCHPTRPPWPRAERPGALGRNGASVRPAYRHLGWRLATTPSTVQYAPVDIHCRRHGRHPARRGQVSACLYRHSPTDHPWWRTAGFDTQPTAHAPSDPTSVSRPDLNTTPQSRLQHFTIHVVSYLIRTTDTDRTELSGLVRAGSVNTTGDKTRQFCLVRVGGVNKLLDATLIPAIVLNQSQNNARRTYISTQASNQNTKVLVSIISCQVAPLNCIYM